MKIIEFPSDLIKEDEDVSIFQYRKGYNLQYRHQGIIYGKEEVFGTVMENVTSGTYSMIELEIIKCLYKFKWLNKKNIERYLNGLNVLPQQLKKPNYDNNINKLRKDGVLATFFRAPMFAGEEHEVVIYRLSEGAYDYVNAFCNIPKTYTKELENMSIDTARAMETLSLNQWYISMLIDKKYTKTWYRKKLRYKKGVFMLDAACRLSVNKEKYGDKTLMLYAFAMPKREDGYVKFINHLLAINAFLQSPENKYKCSVILVTCESIEKIKQAYAALRTFEELDELDCMFVLDNDSLCGTGIDKVYACEYNPTTKGVKYYTTKIELFESDTGIANQ